MDIVENEHPSDRRWREIMQRPRADDQGISVVDWWDVRLDAQDWFKAKDIRPDQAALLLFGHKVPNEVDLEQALAEAKTLTIFDDGRKVSETREGVYLSPEDFVHTFEVFSRFKREEPKARSLRAWLAIAESENLPHLSWVRAYITEKGWPLLEEPASVAAQEATSPMPAAGSSAQEDGPPAAAAKGHKATDIDYRALATPDDLVSAFGSRTGMKKEWFTPSNLRAKPDLLAARLVVGKGGRGKRATPAMFCPVAVLRWLLKPKRKAGRKISEEAGWRLLESHFAHAYSKVKGEDITRRKKLLARKLP